jgi:pimeloyl-ACP methyl ester carboxylesterase
MNRKPLIVTLALAGALAACAGAPPLPYKAPRLELLPCQVRDVAEPLLCGTLEVPEDRARPQRRTVSLSVVVVPAVSLTTLPPLYHLEGGPGVPASGSAGFWAVDGMIHRRNRDVVLVDQRGTGGSGALACAVHFANPLEAVLDRNAVRYCRQKLPAGIDITQYSTAAAVADLDAVREALGHEIIDLSGLSYGTRLAQEYLRKHPARVRAMALLGTVTPQEKLPLSFAPNAHDVLMRLARQCEADAGCRRAVPRPAGDIEALRARFKAGPVRATLADGKAVTLEAGPFWEAVRAQLTTTASQRRLPWLLHEAARGRFAPLLAAAPSAPDADANGLLLSVTCPEDTRHITSDELAPLRDTVFGDYRVRQQAAACREWPGAAVSRNVSIVTSDVPALLIAGGMDHVTPVQWARDVASGLVNARVVVVPDLGHLPGGLDNMECYDRVIRDFFDAGSAANLDLSCIETMRAPPFQAGG